ncbi:cell envelope integrity protein TolA [Vibrio sp. SNU_ST1]|jgi:colicin import membrane protein|uniref:cell envelope integrity protein TolA n=1 Tax=Vibrio sp. SNU_ST1 TaxID=3064001 RepID=UPI0027296BC3|nr:cell envelope integrity protein TolA [Vibrio sp. SNU_ST1]WKY59048.1 cell envelope integrity protein TolA [Vibrio sp. SNU_ST1]
MKANNKKSNNFRSPLLISLGLHVVLFVALIWGADFTMSEPKPTGQMVQAVVIDPQLVRQQAQQIRQQREAASKKEQERLDKLRRESERLEKNRKAEEENIRKLKEKQAKEAKAARDAEKRRVENEKQRKVEEARLKQEKKKAAKAEADRKLKEAAVVKAEKERKAKEAAIAKAEQERVAKEKAAKEAAEKARKEKEAAERAEKQRIAKEKEAAARAEKERKQQEAALNDIFAGLETEATQNSSARQQFISDEAQRYGAIYTQLIQQNLLLEDSYRGRSCRVNLKLIPTGSNAILGRLSILDGDSRLCAATKRAVAQVQSYPLPKDPDIIKSLKDINLTVSPE